jgi:type IV pilus assembly protein PilA
VKKITQHAKRGFTLIELMIVVAIIGILAAIAVPNFTRFQAKSKQSEARTNLKAMYTAAQSYYAENDSFQGGMNGAILVTGYAPMPNNRYTYIYGAAANSIAGTLGGACSGGVAAAWSQTSFTGTACGNIDQDAFIDAWQITDQNVLSNGPSLGSTAGDDVVN